MRDAHTSFESVGFRTDAAGVPAEAFAAARPTGGEHRLVVAVLDDAVALLSKRVAHRTREDYREAWEWVLSDDTRDPFTFRNVCDLLNIDPEAVRAKIRRAAYIADVRLDEGVERRRITVLSVGWSMRPTGVLDAGRLAS